MDNVQQQQSWRALIDEAHRDAMEALTTFDFKQTPESLAESRKLETVIERVFGVKVNLAGSLYWEPQPGYPSFYLDGDYLRLDDDLVIDLNDPTESIRLKVAELLLHIDKKRARDAEIAAAPDMKWLIDPPLDQMRLWLSRGYVIAFEAIGDYGSEVGCHIVRMEKPLPVQVDIQEYGTRASDNDAIRRRLADGWRVAHETVVTEFDGNEGGGWRYIRWERPIPPQQL